MTHVRAIRELRASYTRRGTWLYIKHYGLWRFVRNPTEVLARAEVLTTGAFA